LLDDELVEKLVQAIEPLKGILTEDCLFAPANVVSETRGFEWVVLTFGDILRLGESRAPLVYWALVAGISWECISLVERKHVKFFKAGEYDSIPGIC
jgi:hypothetical protein